MSHALRTVYVLDAVRTPIGRYAGGLASVRPDDLAAHVVRALVRRQPGASERLDHVVFGATNQAGEDNRNVARMAALLAGLPYEVPAVTVNRLCGSGLEAVADAARMIAVGEASCAVAVAGMEGALPSVLGGLLDRPVFAVPTSVGYGAHFGGLAPLLTMLNSCAAGVSVVNVDNGFGAGYLAALVNRQTHPRMPRP